MGKVYERPRMQITAIKLGVFGQYENVGGGSTLTLPIPIPGESLQPAPGPRR